MPKVGERRQIQQGDGEWHGGGPPHVVAFFEMMIDWARILIHSQCEEGSWPKNHSAELFFQKLLFFQKPACWH